MEDELSELKKKEASLVEKVEQGEDECLNKLFRVQDEIMAHQGAKFLKWFSLVVLIVLLILLLAK